MTKSKADEMPSCDVDDWLVVDSDDSSGECTAPEPPPSPDKPRLEAPQAQNQILDSDGPSTEEEGEEPRERTEQESDSNQTLLTEKKPQSSSIFQLLVWHNGLETPVELVDETQTPLVVVTGSSCSRKDLRRMVREMVLVQPQLRVVFPRVTRENADDVIQVCERSSDTVAWVPLGETEGLSSTERGDKEGTEASSAAKLQLTSQIDLGGERQWRQLLVETTFDEDELTDWRRGRFYSDVQENAWRFQLQIGQLIDALDTDRHWYESRVVDRDAVYVKVHYRGWTSKWDEWLRLTSVRLAPLHTKVPNWRAFQVGDEILVGSEVPSKRYPEWRNARVTACDSEAGSFQIEVEVDGNKKWLDAQDELICPKGTHKAVKASTKVASAVLAAPPSLLFNYFERPDGLSPSSPASVQAENDVESVRKATRAIHLAGSDDDGDEWCVVDDDCDAGGGEGEAAAEGDSEVENSVTDCEVSAAEDSAVSSTSTDPNSSTENSDEQATGHSASRVVDRIFATTTEVLDGQMNTTIREEDGWRYQLQIDQLIDARDTDNAWYESRVVAVSSTLVKLHYRGWTSKWDEWIERTSMRIAPLHTKVRNWRDFKVGNDVMVGQQVATKKYPEWRDAVVTACEACEVDGRLRIEVDVDGSKQWLDAQDEMLCPPGTHKATNSSMLKRMVTRF